MRNHDSVALHFNHVLSLLHCLIGVIIVMFSWIFLLSFVLKMSIHFSTCYTKSNNKYDNDKCTFILVLLLLLYIEQQALNMQNTPLVSNHR